MQKLPSLTSTFGRTCKLYAQSFIDVLPYLLLMLLAKFLLDKFLPQQSSMTASFFLRVLLDIMITSFFFSFIIFAIYQKYQSQQIHFMQSIINGASRFGQIFIAYLLLSLPVVLTLALIEVGDRLLLPDYMTREVFDMQKWISLSMIGVALLITFILFVYSFVAGIFIVIKKENAILGLKHSWRLIQSFWLDTLLLVILFGMLNISLSLILDEFHIFAASQILTFLMSSFYPSLMVIHFEQMDKIQQFKGQDHYVTSQSETSNAACD